MDMINKELSKTTKYIVGVSGGVDSMALLDMLRKKEYQIIVCHVDYQMREDSNINKKIVEIYCQKYQIPYYCKDVKKEEYTDMNFQMQARILRYQFYQEIGDKYHTNDLILGHHKDDHIETIVMQQQRKATKGYLGISKTSIVQNMRVHRPFLSIYKRELYDYCHENDVPYYEDYTNFETDFTRDYIRNVDLPKYTNEEKEEIVYKASMHNQAYQDKLMKIKEYLEEYHEKGCVAYSKIPKEYLDTCIYEMLKEVVYPPKISNALIEEISKQIYSKKPNVEIALPVNSVFIKEYDNIYVSTNNITMSYCLKYSDLVYDTHDYFYLSKSGHIDAGIYLKETDFPIYIRNYRPGDVISTSGGTKKVARLFIDKKVPKKLRKTWPIVQRHDGTIVLIPNIAKNIDYLYTKPNLFVIKYNDLRGD